MNALNEEKRPPWNRGPRSNKNKVKAPIETAERKDVESKHKNPINKCGRRGYDKMHKKCPAMGQQCGYCKKMNHFSKMCLAKEVLQLQEVAETDTEPEGDSDHARTL